LSVQAAETLAQDKKMKMKREIVEKTQRLTRFKSATKAAPESQPSSQLIDPTRNQQLGCHDISEWPKLQKTWISEQERPQLQ